MHLLKALQAFKNLQITNLHTNIVLVFFLQKETTKAWSDWMTRKVNKRKKTVSPVRVMTVLLLIRFFVPSWMWLLFDPQHPAERFVCFAILTLRRSLQAEIRSVLQESAGAATSLHRFLFNFYFPVPPDVDSSGISGHLTGTKEKGFTQLFISNCVAASDRLRALFCEGERNVALFWLDELWTGLKNRILVV